MIIPVRCYSCGKVICDKWRYYQEKTDNNQAEGSKKIKVLDELGITRYCCKRMFLSHVDLIEIL